MKNQYFGDVNDYRKYGLLRVLSSPAGLSLGVAWMLTPDDGGTDGRLRRYLSEPQRWRHHDPELYTHLEEVLDNDAQPSVGLIERAAVLDHATFFSDLVPDDSWGRASWAQRMCNSMSGCDLVFLDPDNGFEVRSRPIGRTGSSKYAAWHEVEQLWGNASSVLVYQHYCRERRDTFAHRLADEMRARTGASAVEGFSTPHVLFLLAIQPKHEARIRAAIDKGLWRWGGQIQPVGLLG